MTNIAQSRHMADHDTTTACMATSRCTSSKAPAVQCQAVEDAINAGIDRFSFDDRDRVKTAQKELRISDSLAKELLDTVSRKAFTGFVTRSRSQRDRLEAAKELKKLVFFSNIVVAPLLEDVQVRQRGSKAAVLMCVRSRMVIMLMVTTAALHRSEGFQLQRSIGSFEHEMQCDLCLKR